MNSNYPFTHFGVGTVLVTLVIAIIIMSTPNMVRIESSYAQPTLETPSSPDATSSSEPGAGDDGENFQQFMECLFGGQASEEDISNVLAGDSASAPTEQEIRDCFTPLYNTGSTTGTTTTSGTETGDSGPSEDDEESGTNDEGTSEDEGEPEE